MKPAKAKSPKKKSQLTKPKRPMSAYNFFFKAERARIAATSGRDPNVPEDKATFRKIGCIIGERWKKVSPEDHAVYKKLAAKDSARYQREMKEFYDEELTSMCLGQNGGADSEDAARPYHESAAAAPAAAAAAASRDTNASVADSAGGMAAAAALVAPQAFLDQNTQLMDFIHQQHIMEPATNIAPAALLAQGSIGSLNIPMGTAGLATQSGLGISSNVNLLCISPEEQIKLLLVQERIIKEQQIAQGAALQALLQKKTAAAPAPPETKQEPSSGFDAILKMDKKQQDILFSDQELFQLLQQHIQCHSASPSDQVEFLAKLLSKQQQNQRKIEDLSHEIEAARLKSKVLEQILTQHGYKFPPKTENEATDDRKPAALIRSSVHTAEPPFSTGGNSSPTLDQLAFEAAHLGIRAPAAQATNQAAKPPPSALRQLLDQQSMLQQTSTNDENDPEKHATNLEILSRLLRIPKNGGRA